jgi:hypothetical protein
MSNLSQVLTQLHARRKNIQKELTRLDHAITGIRGLVGNHTMSGRPRRRLSVAARKRIAAAQRARWAKVRQMKKAA